MTAKEKVLAVHSDAKAQQLDDGSWAICSIAAWWNTEGGYIGLGGTESEAWEDAAIDQPDAPEPSTLRQDVDRLRAIPGTWKQREDPLADLQAIHEGRLDDVASANTPAPALPLVVVLSAAAIGAFGNPTAKFVPHSAYTFAVSQLAAAQARIAELEQEVQVVEGVETPHVGFMQRVGNSRCIRCDFQTDPKQPFSEQDAALMAHLAEKHPNWMFDNVRSPEPISCAPDSTAPSPKQDERVLLRSEIAAGRFLYKQYRSEARTQFEQDAERIEYLEAQLSAERKRVDEAVEVIETHTLYLTEDGNDNKTHLHASEVDSFRKRLLSILTAKEGR